MNFNQALSEVIDIYFFRNVRNPIDFKIVLLWFREKLQEAKNQILINDLEPKHQQCPIY